MSNGSPPGPPDAEAMLKLFKPRSVAIVGASSDPSKLSGRTVSYLSRLGFQGAVYPIHPVSKVMNGYRCYRDIRDVPELVDTVVIARPAAEVPTLVEQCLTLGVRAFVVFSSGFAESDSKGAELQARLIELCHASKAVLCGPNGTGLAYLKHGVALSSMSNLDVDFKEGGSVALISNSGSIAAMIYQGNGQLFNLVVSTGNEAVLSADDYISFAIEDPDTSGVVTFIEGIRNPQGLLLAADRATALGKMIVVLKGGRTSASADVAASHTGALVDDDTVVDAMFRHANILRVDTVEGLKTTALLMHAARERTVGPRIGIVTPSGGTAVLMTDLVGDHGLSLPALHPSTRDRMRTIVPDVTVKNPMDVTGFGADPASFGQFAEAIAEDPGIDVLMAPMGGAVGDLAAGRAEALIDLSHRSQKLIVPIWQSTTRNQPGFETLSASGLPVFTDYAVATQAVGSFVGHMARRGRTFKADRQTLPRAAFDRINAAMNSNEQMLSEPGAKAVLSAAGLAIPAFVRFTESDISRPEAPKIAQFPAVLKIVSCDILHKNAVGGVDILRNASEIAGAAVAMTMRVTSSAPAARLDGFLLEEMVLGGTEFFVGIKRDVRFGLIISFGLGGALVNSLAHIVAAALPLSRESATDLVRRFTSDWADSPIEHALLDMLLRVAAVAEGFGERLDILEVNPVRLLLKADRAETIILDGVIKFVDA